MEPELQRARQLLRSHMRHLRRSLDDAQQFQASQQLAEHAILFAPIAQAQRIALFFSMDGEINTRALIARLWHLGKTLYLPCIDHENPDQLSFQRYSADTPLEKHPLGMLQPVFNADDCCPMAELEVILVPLVAFDSQGQRLGMGGGFYDRLLVDWHRTGSYPIGIAHDCQHVTQLPVASWDIPLPAVITPAKLWQWPEHEKRGVNASSHCKTKD